MKDVKKILKRLKSKLDFFLESKIHIKLKQAKNHVKL
jgi:hypothetical protein